MSSPDDPVQDQGCVDSTRAIREVYLNASALSYKDKSFMLTLTYDSQTSTEHSPLKFPSLLDSGSTDTFIDSKFVQDNNVPTSSIPSVNLRLFDGSLSPYPITEVATLPVTFPSGEILTLDFYVSPLDPSCKAVLGYSFLSRYNPLIDWASKTLTFRNTVQVDSLKTSLNEISDESPSNIEPSALSTASLDIPRPSRSNSRTRGRARALQDKFPFEPIYTYPSIAQRASQVEYPDVDIALIGAAAFNRVCKESGREPILIRALHSEVLA